MKKKPIYVEIPIQANMESLWDASQVPEKHEQWDIRFTSITYLPKEENEPQQFTYKTKLAPGIQIEGWGESVGAVHAKDGSRTSSLHFGTEQSLSLIREGRGYWKYKPEPDGTITFLTRYDYQTNFGRFGEIIDKYFFRPLIGWGTALSFDVLKRWLEKRETPATQYVRFFSQWLLVFLFSFIWLYHGLVPKIIHMHAEEVAMVQSTMNISAPKAQTVVMIVGIIEVMIGLIWLFIRNKRFLFGLQIIVFPILTVSAIVADSSYLNAPFNPLTFNAALFIISIIGFINSLDVPTARSCKRRAE